MQYIQSAEKVLDTGIENPIGFNLSQKDLTREETHT